MGNSNSTPKPNPNNIPVGMSNAEAGIPKPVRTANNNAYNALSASNKAIVNKTRKAMPDLSVAEALAFGSKTARNTVSANAAANARLVAEVKASYPGQTLTNNEARALGGIPTTQGGRRKTRKGRKASRKAKKSKRNGRK